MVVTYQLALAATVKRVSDVYGGTPSVPDEAKNIPYRQLVITTTGAVAAIGSTAGVTAPTGFPLAVSGQLILGPFATGPVKLSDLYAIGAGATLTVLGVPF
jgi:hypothetical protein